MRCPVCSKLVLFLIIVTLALMVTPASFAAVITASVRGTVRNQEGGAPIKNAVVQLFQPGVSKAVDYAVTDASGSYSFTGIEPGAYNLSVTSQSFQGVTSPVSLIQDETVSQDFNLLLQTHAGSKTTRIVVSPINRTSTSTTYTTTKQDELEREPNPTASFQFPGLVVGVPGVTFDPSGGYVHLDGSDENEVGFQVDGISNIESLDGQFTTNIVSVGLKDSNVEIGGQDSSVGGSLGGDINEVTKTGRDLVSNGKSIGGSVSFEAGPGHGWNYSGSDDEIGGTLGDKADFYLSTVVFRNRFPQNYNGTYNLPDSYDGLFKVDLYPTTSDTLTAYYGKGNEEYELLNDQQPVQFFRDTNNFENSGNPNFKSHEMQGYETSYFSYQHKFNNRSFIQYKIDNNPEHIDLYYAFANEGGYDSINKTVNDLSYQNQLTKTDRVTLGYQNTPEHDLERRVFSYQSTNPNPAISVGPYATDEYLQLEGAPSTVFGYLEEDTNMKFNRNAVYLDDQFKPLGEKLTLTGGIRDEQLEYETEREGNFTKIGVDPRLGAVYSPTSDFLIRASYGLTTQFAGGRYVEFESPVQSGLPATSNDPATQTSIIDNLFTPGKPAPATSYNTNVGFEKGFKIDNNIVGGSYSLGVTGYQRIAKNELDRLNSGIAGDTSSGFTLDSPRTYQSAGHGHDAGVELLLTKRARGTQDQAFNGFLTYTNSISKATDTFFDTAYYPYFYNAFRFVPGLTQAQFQKGLDTEYPTSYDQKHTVYAEINKRVGKVVNFHLNLDAGSGYPYTIGVSNLGIAGAGLAPGVDSQHTGSTSGVFSTVPVVLPNGNSLQPLNPTPGQTGWHYKITLNTDFDITKSTQLFINADNLFDRKTVLIYSPIDAYGNLYYTQPTFANPQGKVFYGPSTILLPVFISFGIREKF